MTNRTVEIKGYGFGSSPAQITVTLEGNTIFSGAVTTADATPPTLPNLDLTTETVTLCTFELPVSFSGEKAMTCTVTSGTVIFAQINSNYMLIPNPVYSEFDYNYIMGNAISAGKRLEIISSYAVPPFSAEETATLESTDPALVNEQLAILAAHGVSFEVSSGLAGFYDINSGSDSRANVVIDGTPVTAPHSPEYEGSWWWKIASGSTLAYNIVVDAGMA